MKICLVEDNDAILAHLRRLTGELAGARVVGEARDEARALELIRATSPDIIVLDLKLARGSGMGVLRGLADHRPRPRVVVLTNSSADAYRQRCLALGADAFLDKTREFEQLPGVLTGMAASAPQASGDTPPNPTLPRRTP